MSKLYSVVYMCAAFGCVATRSVKISPEDAIKIAESIIAKEYPNVRLDNYDVVTSGIIRVEFRKRHQPDVVVAGGGLDVLVDPDTAKVIGVVPIQ
jgi:hypothetical protein